MFMAIMNANVYYYWIETKVPHEIVGLCQKVPHEIVSLY